MAEPEQLLVLGWDGPLIRLAGRAAAILSARHGLAAPRVVPPEAEPELAARYGSGPFPVVLRLVGGVPAAAFVGTGFGLPATTQRMSQALFTAPQGWNR